MKGLRKILFTLLLIIPGIVLAAGSVTVNKTSVSVEEGKSVTIAVAAKNAAGKVTISSGDKSIATVDKASEWVENQTLNVTIKGVKAGTTKVTVVVDAATFDEEVIKKTYTVNVTVTKPKSGNANLASLNVDGSPVSNFSAGKLNYALGTTRAATITIDAKAADEKAKVEGNGSKNLKYGKNTLKVVVTAENGTKKTYVITITKVDERSSDNDLKSLSISAGSINFNKNTTSYTLKVGHDVSSVVIKAEANDKAAGVSGTGTKTLKDYNNTFNVVVTAENQTKKTYTIKIIRADAQGNYGQLSKDNDLKSLSVEGYELAFSKDKTSYDLIVEEDVDTIVVNAVAQAEQALVSVSGNEGLKAGENEVKVTVTAENGDVKTYTINVFKKGEPEAEEPAEEPKETAKKEDKKADNDNIWKKIAIVSLMVNAFLLIVLIAVASKKSKR